MRLRIKRNPGAVGKTAAGADKKAGELLRHISKKARAKKAYPAQAARKERNPQKTWAHAELRSGIPRGLITAQPCEICGTEATDGHHDDYDRPLDVRWLCRGHHKQVHPRRAKP